MAGKIMEFLGFPAVPRCVIADYVRHDLAAWCIDTRSARCRWAQGEGNGRFHPFNHFCISMTRVMFM